MVGFIVPFRSKSSSNDWLLHSLLLNRTLKSICQQTDSNFKIWVVYTDLPVDPYCHQQVEYIHFPFKFLLIDQIKGVNRMDLTAKEIRWYQNAMDQGRRILFGCIDAKAYGCNFIMSVDADDLVSKHLVEYVERQPERISGWFIDKGYVHNEGSMFVYKYESGLNEFSGSTNIVKAYLIPDCDFQSTDINDFNFFSAHGWLKTRVKDLCGEELYPIPFYALLYSRNTGSWTFEKRNFLKRIAKLLLSGKIINDHIRDTFGLY